MSSDLSVGTAVQSGNRTIVTGTTSGLDTNSLIENSVAQNNAKADQIDIRIQENQEQIDAYNEYFGLAQSLQDSLSGLKSSTSRVEDEASLFDQRIGSLSSAGSDGLISVTLEEGAPTGSYQFTVEQKAEVFSIGSTIVSDKDADFGGSGIFEINLDGYTAQEVTVDTTDSLQDIADKINATSEESGIEASILKISETDYQLILSGVDTNQAMNVQTLSGNLLQTLGFVDATDTFEAAQIIQNEQGSIITYNGATITRDDNQYDDLIEGIDLQINAAEPGTTITLDVNNDASATKDAIVAFVNSYNAYRDFVIQNQQVNADGTLPEDAVLFSEPLLENLSFDLTNLLAGSGNAENSSINSLRDLGISFDEENRLVIDNETALDDALISNFDDVADFFRTDFTSSSSQLDIITNTSSASNLDFDLQIVTDTDGTMLSASVDGDSTAFEIDGTRLIGRNGTEYEGLTLAYVGSDDATISISLTAGIADQMFNLLEGYTNPVDGLIQQETIALQSQNDGYQTEVEEILLRGEEIREREINKYARMEAELARLESLRNTIAALLGNDDD